MAMGGKLFSYSTLCFCPEPKNSLLSEVLLGREKCSAGLSRLSQILEEYVISRELPLCPLLSKVVCIVATLDNRLKVLLFR